MTLAAVCDKKVKLLAMLRNCGIVYAGNFIGAAFIAYMMAHSGIFDSGNAMLGATTIKIATYKVNITFGKALLLGIMCNRLACLAVCLSPLLLGRGLLFLILYLLPWEI